MKRVSSNRLTDTIFLLFIKMFRNRIIGIIFLNYSISFNIRFRTFFNRLLPLLLNTYLLSDEGAGAAER